MRSAGGRVPDPKAPAESRQRFRTATSGSDALRPSQLSFGTSATFLHKLGLLDARQFSWPSRHCIVHGEGLKARVRHHLHPQLP